MQVCQSHVLFCLCGLSVLCVSECTSLWSLLILFVFQAVYREDPEYVIKRINSGRYAVNSDVRDILMKALVLVSKDNAV